jgi:hypothetical protein
VEFFTVAQPLKIDIASTMNDVGEAIRSAHTSTEAREALEDAQECIMVLNSDRQNLTAERDMAIHEVQRWASRVGALEARLLSTVS